MTNDGDELSQRERIEQLHGMEAIEDSDSSERTSRLPFDPRVKGPKDVIRDARAWAYHRRFWIVGAGAALVLIAFFVDVPTPELPVWSDVATVAGGIGLITSLVVGRRVGDYFASEDYHLISQLDAKTGDQLLIKISTERWQELAVVDYEGENRSRNYLSRIQINGEPAAEVDRYYPSVNKAVASWQAGASNKELREFEAKVDRVKTTLEKEANEAIETRVNAEEEARRQASEVSNYLLAVSEGVLTPGDGGLADRLDERSESDSETTRDSLDALEGEIFGSSTNGNGHEQPNSIETGEGVVDELRDRANQLVLSMQSEGGDDGDD